MIDKSIKERKVEPDKLNKYKRREREKKIGDKWQREIENNKEQCGRFKAHHINSQ